MEHNHYAIPSQSHSLTDTSISEIEPQKDNVWLRKLPCASHPSYPQDKTYNPLEIQK